MTLRQLQWWDETGIVSPRITGEGHGWRCYTDADCRMVQVVKELRRKGVAIQKIRSMLKKLRECRSAFLIISSPTGRPAVHWCQSATEAVNLIHRLTRPAILLILPGALS